MYRVGTVVRQPELRHFRYLIALDEERHFGRAAARVGIAQPPFSQQIIALEASLGVQLVERRPQVRLTPSGEVFVETGRRLLAAVSDCVADTQRAARGEIGRVRLGFAASTLMTRLPAALSAFRRTHPHVDLDLREMPSAAQMGALADGTIDIGIAREVLEPPPLVQSAVLLREGFVAVLPGTHRLADSRRIDLYELRHEPFVMFRKQVAPTLHAMVSRLFQHGGFEPRVTVEALEWITIVGLVEAGLGVSLIPESFRKLRLGSVAYVSLGADTTTSVSICMSRSSENPARDALAATLRTSYERGAGQPDV